MNEQQIIELIDEQRAFFNDRHTRDIRTRIDTLRAIGDAVDAMEEPLYEALREDLGKSRVESFMTEIFYIKNEIKFIIKHLPRWIRPQRVPTELMNWPAKSFLHHEPLGISLVIAPWNYPVQLTIAPLLYSIAAGNCVIVKPSEIAPASSAAIASLFSRINPRHAAVVEGAVETNKLLLKQHFDHIFFTGSTRVGKIVMKAAAEHLTPVLLELGGKSPCIVHRDAKINVTARRIVWGKLLNAGQTCIAPDYLYVHEDIVDDLMTALTETTRSFYSDNPAADSSYPCIISDAHFQRLRNLLTGDEKSIGVQNPEKRLFPPTFIRHADREHPAMQEEIFGPIFPILTYRDIETVISDVNNHSNPLALYLFTRDRDIERAVTGNTSSGGVCINDTIRHITSAHLPFGGVGESGMGKYHGKAGFDAFTNTKSIMRRSFHFDISAIYPPYTSLKKIKRLLRFF